MASKKQSFELTVFLSGIDRFEEELVDAFFEAGCDDATLAVSNGRAEAHFSREAESLPNAYVSVLRDVRKVMSQYTEVRVLAVLCGESNLIVLSDDFFSKQDDAEAVDTLKHAFEEFEKE